MRFFLELSYKGTAYHGWQRQPNAPSVQQTIEEALTKLLREPIELTGAGRTDTGVHASRYFAHFEADGVVDRTHLLYHTNSMLPPDIALHALHPVPDEAHARFDATEREYTYYITPRKDPFRADTAWHYPAPLDLDAMNAAAAHLLTESDFTSFAKLHSANKTNICHITRAMWRGDEFPSFARRGRAFPSAANRRAESAEQCSATYVGRVADGVVSSVASPVAPIESSGLPRGEAPLASVPARSVALPPVIPSEAAGRRGISFTIRSDRFLRNMVRAIVGTLVDVGRGKITPERFAEIIRARDLSLSSAGAPAHGLFLTDIKYPNLKL